MFAFISNTVSWISLGVKLYNAAVRSFDKNEVLLAAAAYGNLDKMEQQINLGADIEYQEPRDLDIECVDGLYDYLRPLHQAAKWGQEDAVKYLLNNGALINACTGRLYRTPLFLSVKYNHLRVAEILVAHGADVNPSDDSFGISPLRCAVYNENESMVKLLIEHGAIVTLLKWNKNSYDKERKINFLNSVIIKYSLNAPLISVVSAVASSELLIAAEGGDLEKVKELVELGADIEYEDVQGQYHDKNRALHYAAKGGHSEIVQYLLDKGARPSIPNDCNLWTPLHLAARNGHLKIAGMLIKAGANIDPFDWDEKTPLAFAVIEKHEYMVELLIHGGADVSKIKFLSSDGKRKLDEQYKFNPLIMFYKNLYSHDPSSIPTSDIDQADEEVTRGTSNRSGPRTPIRA